jgi:hypothetical protein
VKEKKEVFLTEKIAADKGRAFGFTDLGTQSAKALLGVIN